MRVYIHACLSKAWCTWSGLRANSCVSMRGMLWAACKKQEILLSICTMEWIAGPLQCAEEAHQPLPFPLAGSSKACNDFLRMQHLPQASQTSSAVELSWDFLSSFWWYHFSRHWLHDIFSVAIEHVHDPHLWQASHHLVSFEDDNGAKAAGHVWHCIACICILLPRATLSASVERSPLPIWHADRFDMVASHWIWLQHQDNELAWANMVFYMHVVIKWCILITPRSRLLSYYQDRRCWHESNEHGTYLQQDRRCRHDTKIRDAYMRWMKIDDVDMKITDVDTK